MPPLPSPVRAALGLAVTVLDEARHLPDKAIELPMRAVSRALQLSLRAQQRYAALAARGDEVLSSRQITDEPPSWATFDEATDEPATPPNSVSRPRPTPTKSATKTVRAPRTGKVSAFDAVDEPEDGPS
jgi:hypothetical protein